MQTEKKKIEFPIPPEHGAIKRILEATGVSKTQFYIQGVTPGKAEQIKTLYRLHIDELRKSKQVQLETLTKEINKINQVLKTY